MNIPKDALDCDNDATVTSLNVIFDRAECAA